MGRTRDTVRLVSASVNLPLKSRSSLLAPDHLGGPGKRAVKRLWCGGKVGVQWLAIDGL